MIGFDICIDAKAFLRQMAVARKRFSEAVVAAVRHAASLASEHAKQTSLFKDRTGDLRRSVRAIDGSSPFEAKAVAQTPYAMWVERGNGFRTGAAFITPKHGKYLRFEIDGQRFALTQVRTSKPRPFMAQASKYAEPHFESLCREAVEQMFS